MLINIRLLFAGGAILWVVFAIVVFGTLGKAIAAYISCVLFKLPLSSGHMMFGLTSAHAAGASPWPWWACGSRRPTGCPWWTTRY